MTTPCIICVAITGSLPTKADNPAVPITVAEQVESAHAAVEAGAFVEYFPVESLRMRVEVRHGLYGHDGIVATGGADYVASADRFTFSVGPRIE